jgi:osmotically-inducible protein OsmY
MDADRAEDLVEDALEADSTLRAFDLDADDENGRVVLTGAVRTAAQRQRAEDVAKRVAPGITLDNRIRVE